MAFQYQEYKNKFQTSPVASLFKLHRKTQASFQFAGLDGHPGEGV